MFEKLSASELNIVHNKQFFKVKASATKKIELLIADVRDDIKNLIETNKLNFPKEVDAAMGKIFRGENYLGLPYLVLDYPKHFSKESVFAFRTMFWWGNFFSCTLHLQGSALEQYRSHLIRTIQNLKKKKTYICINDNPWQYHYKKNNYVLIDTLSPKELKELIEKKDFIKLSVKISIKNYKQLPEFSKESFLGFLA